MADILFVTWDGGGNVPPALGIAAELAGRGHRTRFLGHASQEADLRAAGHEVAARAIVKDDVETIRAEVGAWIADKDIDVVVTTGGTGFTGRDVTPEAIRPLFEKEVDGFSAVFHMISFENVGTSTIQSRACAGLAHGTYIFCLPGSPGACRDAWNGILVHQLDNRHRPCNLVEIMPRLEEHRRGG